MDANPTPEQRLIECLQYQTRTAILLCEGTCQHFPRRVSPGHYTEHVRVELNRYACGFCGTVRTYGASDPYVSQSSFWGKVSMAAGSLSGD